MSISLHELRFSYLPADTLDQQQVEELVALNDAAVREVYDDRFRTHPDVIAAIGDSDVTRYADRLKNPGADKRHQLYAAPHITLARHHETDEILGWVFSANNTSGEDAAVKMEAHSPLRRWQWLGWIATRPDAMHASVATACVAVTIARSELLQPVSAYAWPGEYVAPVLIKNGLKHHGDASPTFPESSADHLNTRRYTSKSTAYDFRRELPHKLLAIARTRILAVD